jgi:hypothetical protein
MAGERLGTRGRLTALALALAAGCGYSFSAAGQLTGGLRQASVRPFENRSTEPELGAALGAAVREELAARGALHRGESRAVVVGEVSVGRPTPAAPGGVSWRVAVDVKARLLDGERVVAERTLRREADYAAGLDPLETEGRRAQALKRLAADCARELVASMME